MPALRSSSLKRPASTNRASWQIAGFRNWILIGRLPLPPCACMSGTAKNRPWRRQLAFWARSARREPLLRIQLALPLMPRLEMIALYAPRVTFAWKPAEGRFAMQTDSS
jgi:hypothetical protein